MLGVHRALVGDYVPRTVATRLQGFNQRVTHDLGARELRALCVGERDTRWIDMTFDGVVHGTHKALRIHERIELGCLSDGEQLQIHSQVPAPCLRHLQPVHAFARAGEHDAASHMHPTRLPGNLFNLAV